MTDRNGYGVLYYENSTHMKYKGNLINNKPHGHGTLYYNNAENTIKYEGGFEAGKYHDFGTAYYEDKTISFRGTFKEGMWSTGYGELYAEKGYPIYKGWFNSEGDYNGSGVLFYENSIKIHYIGNFKQNMFHGKGKILTKSSKVIYDGNFENDEFKGWGKCFGCNGLLYYEGEMKSNLFHGYGKQYFPDGESIKYEGHFSQGLYNGYGTLFDETNRSEIQYEGVFLKGKYSKEVIESFHSMISKYECLRDVQEKMRHTINATKLSKQDINSICETLFNTKQDIEEYDYIRMMEFLKTIY